MKNRKLVALIKHRLKEKDPLIQVIVGPRQVGKTTALKAALSKNDHYYSADYPTPLEAKQVIEWWNKASKSSSKTIAIDEIQKVSDWSHVIKKLWDQDSSVRIILTGSSALLMEKGLTESLAGRFELIQAEHWNYQEAKDIFSLSLEKYILFGCYPGAIRFLDNVDRWGSYIRDSIVEPAIGRDLLQLHPVENPSLLRQILSIALNMPAQVISLQKLQGQLQNKGAISTIQNYLSLLAKGFLVSSLEKYSANLVRGKKSSPKLIVHDNGLIRAFERPINSEISSEKFGRYFENIVGARFIEAGWKTYYWKDRTKEVDFVVLGPNNEKWAIEVKSSKCSVKDLKGLQDFCNIYPEFEAKLVSFVGQEISGIDSLSFSRILSLNRSYKK